ncbi:dihydroxyacetone kinase subunit DhaK [Streptomyces sp. XM83C]|jgi:dihydroxyacetone kinase-like protein|uniref:Dihydroxyacetone kinase subunit DhaK n=1 Tax=Streptomyces thermocoprophilus TaxID=78356 RepID=A0ABV5VCV6_9ACTN|nr:dihydroxyacetone kinase subunit DhaK [Streptomyces sp. XM83C]MCK1822498.1 dihydroxyacetone kinase subunit DhaK [Streptomyces sp. XM83C]
MKKLINSAESLTADALAGMAAAHPDLRIDPRTHVISRADAPVPGKVGVVSGGGAGHEPLHGGYVGRGMLDAAVVGEVFTSPTPDRILAALRAADSGRGVLQIVKNYTGDTLNFAMAAELAEDLGIAVRTVVVDDDAATGTPDGTPGRSAGRRGTGATVFVERVCGALAEQGADLTAVADAGARVNAATRSIAIALTACTVPAVGRAGFELPDDRIEFGVGIHGEPGLRTEPLRPASEIVQDALAVLLDQLPPGDDDRTIVMVNGLGATPLLELYVVLNEASAVLRKAGLTVAHTLVGNYVTALDMAGVSLTVCRADERTLGLWNTPVNTPALRWGC